MPAGGPGHHVEPDPKFAALLRGGRATRRSRPPITPGDGATSSSSCTSSRDRAVDPRRATAGRMLAESGTARPTGGDVARARFDPATTPGGPSCTSTSCRWTRGLGARRSLEGIDLEDAGDHGCWSIEAIEPDTTQSTRHLWEDLVTEARLPLLSFDGLSCFYVSEERDAAARAVAELSGLHPRRLHERWRARVPGAATAAGAGRSSGLRRVLRVRERSDPLEDQAIARWATSVVQVEPLAQD